MEGVFFEGEYGGFFGVVLGFFGEYVYVLFFFGDLFVGFLYCLLCIFGVFVVDEDGVV